MATKFTATHGVEFGEEVKGAYKVWAQFVRDRDLDTPDGAKTYVFSTDDPKVADRLRKVSDYGIREVEQTAKAAAEPA